MQARVFADARRIKAIVAEALAGNNTRRSELQNELAAVVVSISSHYDLFIKLIRLSFQDALYVELQKVRPWPYVPRQLASSAEELSEMEGRVDKCINWGAITADDPRVDGLVQPEGLWTPPSCKYISTESFILMYSISFRH
jgi:hypothetical protein